MLRGYYVFSLFLLTNSAIFAAGVALGDDHPLRAAAQAPCAAAAAASLPDDLRKKVAAAKAMDEKSASALERTSNTCTFAWINRKLRRGVTEFAAISDPNNNVALIRSLNPNNLTNIQSIGRQFDTILKRSAQARAAVNGRSKELQAAYPDGIPVAVKKEIGAEADSPIADGICASASTLCRNLRHYGTDLSLILESVAQGQSTGSLAELQSMDKNLGALIEGAQNAKEQVAQREAELKSKLDKKNAAKAGAQRDLKNDGAAVAAAAAAATIAPASPPLPPAPVHRQSATSPGVPPLPPLPPARKPSVTTPLPAAKK